MSLNGEEEDFEWEPPTEAEMKVIQARRERQDQISKVMGDYLLKGYKMLGECCDKCGTILLQDRAHKNYCVSCQELDSDVDKDNPALNAQAALSQVRERRLAAQSPAPSDSTHVNGDAGDHVSNAVPQPRPEHCEGAAAGGRAIPPPPPAATAPPSPAVVVPGSAAVPTTAPSAAARPAVMRPVLRDAEEAVLSKMRWASNQLQSCTSLESSIQLCNLISSCAASLRSLREIGQ
ncbi:protein ZNRD2 [Corythoichthys intestinalis]|uniref:protein ZNRD2 n=1 Tax=Corythoichthys intestinalis TaxID=161448 RepID=UPI0025A5F34A|nr:protein ZNRD2 [Corythoichthys intestinalis]XP_061800981.1 protein ZNRD2-like [Nerophis lumbriciformis]